MTSPTFIQRSLRVAHSFLVRRAIVAVILAAACKTDPAPDPTAPIQAAGRVRFVSLITDTTRGRVNATLEGVPFGVNLTYSGTTPSSLPSPATAIYSPIYTGARSLVLNRTIDLSLVSTINFNVTAGQDNTIYAMGGAGGGAITSVITTDVNTTPAAGQVRLRLVNMSPTGGSLDIFVTAVGGDLTTSTPTASGLAANSAGAYVALAAGTYQVRAVPAGTLAAGRPAAVSVNLASITLAALSNRTIVAADNNVGGAPLRFFALIDR